MIAAEGLVEKVLLLINEPCDDSAITLLSEETRALPDTVRQLLPDAVLFVQNNKVGGVLNPKLYNVQSSAITDNGDGSGAIVLPADFIDLVELSLEGWERPCTVLQSPGSPVAVAQGNRYTRAGCCRPVCVDGVDGLGHRVLRYYSLPAGQRPIVQRFVYEAAFNASDGLSCEPGNPLVQAVVYQCAALLYNVFERAEVASAFMALAVSWCKNGKIE